MRAAAAAGGPLAEARNPGAAVKAVQRMVGAVVDGGLEPCASVGAIAIAVAGRDQRDLRAGAAALAVPVEKAAALLAVVGAGGVAVRPDEGAGVADLELDEGFLGRRAGLRRSEEHTSELQSLMRSS